ncbi:MULTISPECIES: ArsR/SmtB family transcription factor [Acetobacter]|uniref:Metalloregulator ArsR/SmtB family transcription factor n=1 Tax=Acetobacter thailandicus TaxID=1502842 RepID=A0ABT3QDT6_9PROT|nr:MULTISPECIES: metalloregulator ArsR/SmtB family transcription factor [Acetobacter]MCX2563399.1 metalloregulator ArsR/SmtB family transcription factor [Acetobacter thailandicus]NHN94153.1 metalloregulator ArsR/SmtB family transcription factor [Acetobacter thailandicus]OUI88719.1 ArsR family transcriptional regulator [Acetobacter sp. DmW_043]
MTPLLLEEARLVVERLKLFAQPQRLIIVDVLLRGGPLAVSELEVRTGIGQPTLSQQLGTLRRADIIVPRRESRAIYYSLASREEERRARALIGLLRADQDTVLPQVQPATSPAMPATQSVHKNGGGGAQFAYICSPSKK